MDRKADEQKPGLWVVRAFLLTAAAAFTVYGVVTGEPLEVLRKAAHICLECIGVG